MLANRKNGIRCKHYSSGEAVSLLGTAMSILKMLTYSILRIA